MVVRRAGGRVRVAVVGGVLQLDRVEASLDVVVRAPGHNRGCNELQQ